MSTPAIRVKDLRKTFGELEAVRGVTFDVAPGEIFAFLGPNGAGKSTLIKMLCTLALPTAGQAWVGGRDVRAEPGAVRERIGLVFQEQTLDVQLTADENLRFHAVLYGVPSAQIEARMRRVLGMVDLVERRGDLVSTFSGGMARRLEIARGLLHTPDVLFLDEPTVGLDPQTRSRIWADVRRLRDEEAVTVFFSTHYMDEAERCHRISYISYGKMLAAGTVAEVVKNAGLTTFVLEGPRLDRVAEALQGRPGVDQVAPFGATLHVVGSDKEKLEAALADVEKQHKGVTVAPGETSLEDVFIQFMSGSKDNMA